MKTRAFYKILPLFYKKLSIVIYKKLHTLKQRFIKNSISGKMQFYSFSGPFIHKKWGKIDVLYDGRKFLISPCRKNAFFWFSEEILLFRAEILPCGPPLLPHSCAEPFLGVVQKYSFPGDISTSATWSVYRYSH